MRKLTRRKFIQIVGAASTVMAAGLLAGCGDADGGNASGGVSGGSSQEGADTESPSGGAGEPDGSGASDTEIGVVWKEVPLSKTTCDFNGLEFTAKTQEMVLNDYRQDIETGTYVWRGDNVLGVMAYVENKSFADSCVSSGAYELPHGCVTVSVPFSGEIAVAGEEGTLEGLNCAELNPVADLIATAVKVSSDKAAKAKK